MVPNRDLVPEPDFPLRWQVALKALMIFLHATKDERTIVLRDHSISCKICDKNKQT